MTEENANNPASNPADNPASNPADNPASTTASPRRGAGGPVDLLEKIGGSIVQNLPKSEPEFVAKLQRENSAELGKGVTSQASAHVEQGQGQDEKPPKDRKGFYFDAAFCKVDENGEPIVTATGLWEMKSGYKREKVLKKRIVNPQARQVEIPQAKEQLEQQQSQQIDHEKAECESLAVLCDMGAWLLMGFIGEKSVVDKVKPELSPAGIQALTDGFMQLESRPVAPWWVGAAMIYGSAATAVIGHEKSQSKRAKIKEKAQFLWWKISGKKKRLKAVEDREEKAGEK